MENIEQNKIIVEKGNATNQLDQYHDFNRVDFNNPATILSYGKDVLDEMGTLMKSVSRMMRQDELLDDDLDERISKIGSFSDYLEESEKARKKAIDDKKKKKSRGLLALVGKVVEKVSGKEEEEPEKSQTYSQQYEKYCEDIDVIARSVETQKKNTLIDIEMYKSFIIKMEPFIAKLDTLIQVGYQDKETYENGELAGMEMEFAQNGNLDIEHQITLAKQKVEIFSRKLLDLKKNLALSKNTILECQLKQGPNMELVFMYESYNTTVVPSLRIQASSMVGVRRQHDAIVRHQGLVDKTNQAFLKNSQMLIGNIQQTTDLAAGGNIKMETLSELDRNIREGIELLRSGNSRRVEGREKSLEMLSTITSALDTYKDELTEVLTSETIDMAKTFGQPSGLDSGFNGPVLRKGK